MNRKAEREQAALCYLAAQLRLKEVGPAVLAIFGRAAYPILVWEAAKALVELRPAGTGNVLRAALAANPSATKRMAAAWALGNFGQARGNVNALVAAVEDRTTPAAVREHACEALGLLQARSAIPLLRSCLADRSPKVRSSAAYALRVMKVKAALPELARMGRQK